MPKYNGYTPSADDIVIDNYRLVCTCGACPEQYDVFNEETGGQVAYFRLRHGHFRADCPDVGGEIVYDTQTKGDGIFEEDERLPVLTAAVRAVKDWWEELKQANHG